LNKTITQFERRSLAVSFSTVEAVMTSWMYRFLIVGLTFFGAAPLSQPDKDDQPGVLNVHIRDYCDPVTFAAIGCVRTVTPVSAGVITLPGFQAELGADKSVGAWRFVPDRAKADQGLGLMLQNLGGEAHTFTRVQEFGGGFVAPLNAASGNPVPAPECAQTVNGQLAPQPPSAEHLSRWKRQRNRPPGDRGGNSQISMLYPSVDAHDNQREGRQKAQRGSRSLIPWGDSWNCDFFPKRRRAC
jgi:hypothetical protein